ncbi:MAG TPA: DegV family EDD domain-containing protein [bacterium]|nr:DegV family EDD domain-containing protein [bacterium]
MTGLELYKGRFPMKKDHIDGQKLFYAFYHGRKRVMAHMAHLNRINVFPVADGDTGTNLVSTIHAIVKKPPQNDSVADVSRSMAEAALSGSRGNSGIIFAQFIHGLSESMKNKKVLLTHDFAEAARNGVEQAYRALSKPVEGTILTVMKAWSNALEAMHSKTESFTDLFSHSLDAARMSLKETPKKLKVLREAGVVDAGAQGFVHFIEGLLEFFKNPSQIDTAVEQEMVLEETIHEPHEAVTLRYCAEAVLQGENMDPEEIRRIADPFGDSLIVAGSSRQIKVHIHTDDPAELFYRLRSLGNLQDQKVDDMKRQVEARFKRLSPVALLTDSACDLPQHLMDRYQIHMIPVHLSFGSHQFLDKSTLSADRFYTMLDELSDFPKTSQPAVQTFKRMYRFLLEHYESVISIHISSGLSGTCDAARKAAKCVNRRRITVIDSRQLSTAQGLIVLHAAEALEKGLTHEETLMAVRSAVPRSKILVSVPTLKYLVRGGRVSPLKGVLARILNLKPIVSLKDGVSDLTGKAFSEKSNRKKIIDMLEKQHRKTPIRRLALGHAHNEGGALAFREQVEKRLGIKADYVMDISPTIGAHAGVGAISISAQWGD